MSANGVAPPAITLARALVTHASALVGRRTLAGILGQQFDGRRDLYEALGYVRDPQIEDYLARYDRQDIAARIVDLPAQDTWKQPPVVRDGARNTAFNRAWQEIVKRLRVWHALERIDRLAGVGRYGVLLVGVRDGKRLDEPLDGRLSGPRDVLFLSPFSEGSALISQWVRDRQDPRYRLPELYTLQFGDENGPGGSERVHWSRVIHVADDLLESDVYGTPRLRRVLNRLDDLEKIAGGAAEAAWRNMDRGLHVDIAPEYSLPPDQEAALSDEIEEYVHQLRRFIRTQGATITPLGSEAVEPRGVFDVAIDLVAAASGIPKRILLGSERGELASSQDERNWIAQIRSRQTSFAEPMILRPFVDMLVRTGALPEPRRGEYEVIWPSLFELPPSEKAAVFKVLRSAGANAEAAALAAGYGEEEAAALARDATPPAPEGPPLASNLRANEGEPTAEERELQAALEGFFRDWRGELAEAIESDDEPEWDEFAAALAALLLSHLASTASSRMLALGAETGVAFDPAEIGRLAAQWARDYSFELVKGLTNTTRELVSQAVEQYALNPAMTKADVARLLEPAFGKARAQMIAATETTRAMAHAVTEYQSLLLQQAGVRTVRVWRTLPGACALLCLPLEGKPETEWGALSAGPPAHVNCRCEIVLEPLKG